ncbi:MAG TPA: aldolase/citrate lyase family protein [Candidatus Limnocylindrales bacterium]|nr:aldolase/citrate lyase family protein [Candidatus Limnocylindrales bacterium]
MTTTDFRPWPGAELRRRILAGETLFGVWASLASPGSAELLGRAGYDWVVVDMEHGYTTESELLAHLTAIEGSGSVALVRPQSGERLRIGRALDMGAAGIVVPRLDTPEQVREAVTFLRYPPTGQRGVALLTRGARLGTVNHAGVAALNDDIVGIVQIESPSALAAADDLAAIDGVDVLFVGPADLSHSLGIPGQFTNPIYQDALRKVVAACRAHGKAPGILLYDHASFRPHLDLGYTFVGLGADVSFVNEGAKAALAAARAR